MNNLKTEKDCSDDQKLICRREFFIGLKKWSKIVVRSAVIGTVGASVLSMNGCTGGGSWANYGYGYGGWGNGVSGWINRRGGWTNRGRAWANGGGGSAARIHKKSWVNRRGGSGGSINRNRGAGKVRRR